LESETTVLEGQFLGSFEKDSYTLVTRPT